MADVVAKFRLEAGSELPIGKSFISSLKSVSESTSDAGSINYGTLANSGSIEIQDGNGYISKMIDDGILPVSDLDVNIEVDGEIFQQHITTDSDYNTEDNTLNISLSNFIKDFDVLKYKGYVYQNKEASLYELFYDVLDSYFHIGQNGIDSMFTGDVLEYIKEIYIEYPTIEYGKTYRSVLDELCTIAQLNMFATKENMPKFVSARPVYASSDGITTLKTNNIVSDLRYTKTLKNKFDGVEISKTNVQDSIDYDTVVFPARIDLSGTSTSNFSSSSQTNQKIETRSQFINAATFYYEIVSYIKSDYYRYTGTVTIPKKSSDNLSQIQSINQSLLRNTEFAYTLKYNKYKATASASSVWDRGDDKVYVGTISYGSDSLEGIVTEGGIVTDTSSYTASLPDGTSTTSSTSTTPANPSVTFSSDSNNYYVTYTICVAKNITKLGGNGRWTAASTSEVDIALSGVRETYKPLELSFSIYGNKRTITFSDMSASSSDIENAKTKASIKSSKLLQTRTTYNGQEISDVIKSNILNDYRSGISDGKLTLNKDLVEIGDLVKYPNDRRVWRVVGKEFDYDGEYLFPISVMQCLKPYAKYGLFDDYDEPIYSWQELLERGLITISGNEISSASVTSESVNNIGNLKIPDDIVSVASLSFKNNTAIETFTMGSSFQTIKSSAFSGCNNLKYIKFSNSLKTIEDSAFNNTDITGSLIIPSNVSYIGNMCFWGCDNIKELSLPTGLTYDDVGASIIQDSINIEKMTFPIECCAEDGLRHYFGDKFFGYQSETNNKNLNVPQSLKELVINGSGAGSITGKLFLNCNHLEKITIGAGVVEIRGYAFEGCSSIKEVYFEDPTGWKILGGTPDLTDPVKNAIMLKETYMQNTWSK